jgi:hypothetical protein
MCIAYLVSNPVDRQVEVARRTARIGTPFAFGRRPVDELLEPTAERHRVLERLDADAHLIAVLDAVVHVEAMDGRSDEPSKNGAALCGLTIHG